MVTKYFFSVLTSASNSHFNTNLNDEEMITSHLMCVTKQFFYDKNVFERKNNNRKKPWAWKHVT